MHRRERDIEVIFAGISKISKIYKEISNIGIGNSRYGCYT